MPFSEEAKKYGPFVRLMYSMVLRGLIKGAINDPDDEWDEQVLEVLDRVFNYEG